MLVQCFYNSELVRGYVVQPDEIQRALMDRGLKSAMLARCRRDDPLAHLDNVGAFEIVLQHA